MLKERLQRAGTFHVYRDLRRQHLLDIADPRPAATRRSAAVDVRPGLSDFRHWHLRLHRRLRRIGRPRLTRGRRRSVARAIDHRTPPVRNVLAPVVAIMPGVGAARDRRCRLLVHTPEEMLAIMLLAQRLADRAGAVLRHIPWRGARTTGEPCYGVPAVGLLVATVAAEAGTAPRWPAFSKCQLPAALNFLAIPLMTVVQVAGIATALIYVMAPIADIAGIVVGVAARGIQPAEHRDAAPLERAACRTAAAMAAARVSARSLCLASLAARRRSGADESRRAHGSRVRPRRLGAAAAIVHAARDRPQGVPDGGLELVLPTGLQPARTFDVAQGDATLIRFPDGRLARRHWRRAGRFDVGTRIVSPALGALGLRRLSTLVLTHGDRDHIGVPTDMLRGIGW